MSNQNNPHTIDGKTVICLTLFGFGHYLAYSRLDFFPIPNILGIGLWVVLIIVGMWED